MSTSNRIVSILILLTLLTSCGKNKKENAVEMLETDDETKISKTEFLAFVDSCVAIPDNFRTFFSRGINFDAESFSAPKLNLNIFFERDKQFVATIALAFPPIEGGRAKVERSQILVKSNYADIPSPMNVGFDIQTILQSILLGKLPPVYLVFGQTSFSNFDVYKKASRYYIEKSDSRTRMKIEMNDDYTLSSIVVSQPQFAAEIHCENYEVVDNINLPKNLLFNINYENKSYIFSMKQRNIEINGTKKLTYE